MKPIKKGIKEDLLNQEYLQSILFYEQSSGLFYWKYNKSNRVKKSAIAGTENNGYISIMINGFNYAAHRLAWLYVYGEWPKNEIDHKNCKRNDNRIVNLRNGSHKHNLENLRTKNSNNKAGYLGVYFNKQKNKYEAAIKHNGKKIYIGRSDSAEKAHELYLNKKRELHQFCTI